MHGLAVPIWAQLAIAVAAAAALVAAVPRRWLVEAMLLWLFSPAFLYAGVVVWELITRPPAINPLGAALLGFMLISALMVIPWLLVSGLGFDIGFGLRRLRPPGADRPAPAPAAPPAQAPEPLGQTASAADRRPVADGAATPNHVEMSPDGTIRVEIHWTEWGNSNWVQSPRVIDVPSGRVVLDLWGSDWDAGRSFPADRTVTLDLRRYHFGGDLTLELDLARDTYQILREAFHEGAFPPEPLAGVAEAVEASSLRVAQLAPQRAQVKPEPLAAWRAALVILATALVVIAAAALLARMSTDRDPRTTPLDTVPPMKPLKPRPSV